MKHRAVRSTLVVVCCALSIGRPVAADEPVAEATRWHTSIEEAKREAAKSGKPILMEIHGRPWCPPCVMQEANILSKPAFQEWAEANVVLLGVQVGEGYDKASGHPKWAKLMQEYKLQGIPMMLFLDSHDGVLGQIAPISEVDQWIDKANEVVSQQKTSDVPTKPQRGGQDHALQIEDLLSQYHEYGQFNGTVLAAEDGRPIFRQGFGMANMEWEIPNTPETKFRIGSVTKQFTAALILQLVEEKKIALDEAITTYLPSYRAATGDQVTVHHLLCHTSGIPSYTTAEFFAEHSRDSYELDEFVERFASGDLEFEPGSEFAYSNSGYHLLGAIIENVTGQSYAEVLEERILEPAGMSDSGFDVSSKILKQRAQGYSKTGDGYVNANYLDMGIPYAAGSMYSTVDDLLKWDKALRAGTILTAESRKLMQTPNLDGYGYGVGIHERELGESGETTRVIAHTGGINGFNALLWSAADQDRVIVILDNVQQGRYHGDIAAAILNILNDQPYDGPRKSIADELRLAIDEDAATMVARYRDLQSEQQETFDFDNEQALNQLGYELLAAERVKDAIEIFKLNVEMFPEAFNPYDSLGEAYLADNQRELALANYKKSVELNPSNESGLLAIRRIEGKPIKVDPAVLESYIGAYQVEPGFVVTITVEDGMLMGEPSGQEKVALECLSETEFIVPSVKARVEFVKNETGKVAALVLKQGEHESTANKIE